MSLRFPERNGEAVIQFEESMEIPRGAEALLRGLYHDPDDVKRGFHSLHQETATLLEILLPRRARLREWLEQLPDQPKEAEKFIRETSEQIQKHDRKVLQIENELITKLEESSLKDLFPLPLTAFAILSYTDPTVKIFLRSLGRLSEVLKLNPDTLRQVVRIHFLYSLLVIVGQDLDGQSYRRGNEDSTLAGIAAFFTQKHVKRQSQEYVHCYLEWVKAWGGRKLLQLIPLDSSMEKVRAAMVFWRRNPSLNWEEVWSIIQPLDSYEFTSIGTERSIEGKFFN
jgi:hypothetical protein